MAVTMTIPELFTEDEIERARELLAACEPGTFATRCVDEIVGPAMARIDRVTGQANDARYMAYALEHTLARSQAPARRR